MTGGIVHDFRNILAVINSGLRLAEKNSGDPRAASTFIAGAREGVARGLTLTSQLLTFAKQREFQVRAADANELLRALELFLKYGAGSEVRILLELSPSIPNCLIDPSQFNAAILNLVINARDAMPKGGEFGSAQHLGQSKQAPLTLHLATMFACGSGTTGLECPMRCFKTFSAPFYNQR